MKTINPTSTAMSEVLSKTPKGQPVVMLNLLKFREQADYKERGGGVSGRDAYREYGRGAIRCIQAVGGQLVWSGRPTGTLIGPEDEQWDEVLLVRYPSLDAFLKMIDSPEYKSIVHHRTAAIEDSRLMPMLES
ncbi:Uncharacterized conserved protein, DUF1330 family [Marinobacter daqiaonensis]|uniref:Uncharacterized conserved protein, DUF1330 family n=1 Tax=Marinobacter daqiaonensis TaxID=650891 RepID=A0A1I6GJ64_9GAMM|nr:DUF1330 domain-containing protein [Marinobacter daqiaonensis]SFR42210.1 Uncharacterized conserved protein, DUF1330 family [Marinobacter daqiaonensis]